MALSKHERNATEQVGLSTLMELNRHEKVAREQACMKGCHRTGRDVYLNEIEQASTAARHRLARDLGHDPAETHALMSLSRHER
jgi:hypothetical protein